MSTAIVDLTILDDGKGVLFALTPKNKGGGTVPLPSGTPPITAVSSAPASLTNAVPDPGDPTLTPPRPPDTTGLVFLSTVPQPPVDATGITMTFSTTLPNGTALTGTTGASGNTGAPAIDVIADNSPVGFSVTETAE